LTVTVCLVVLLGVPLWLVVATAMKSQAEALRPDLSLPQTFHLFENVKEVWTRGEVGAGFAGSCLVMIPSVLIVLIFGSLAAWIFARRTSRVLSVAYAAAISGIILPPAVVTIVLLLRQLGLAGSAIGMVAVYCGIYMSTVIFFVTGFVY
jgi:raffinose/stachyose/melibiose transport system permease protein